MKSSLSNSLNLNWNSKICELVGTKKVPKTILSLEEAGYTQLKDLLWLLPLRTSFKKNVDTFENIIENEHFCGVGKIISIQDKKNFWKKTKTKVPLSTLSVVIQDHYSDKTLKLNWFNCYPSVVQKISQLKYIIFDGEVTSFNNDFQISNPSFNELNNDELTLPLNYWNNLPKKIIVQYPTINSISPVHLSQVFEKIPLQLWDNITHKFQDLFSHLNLRSLSDSFKVIHGKVNEHDLTNHYEESISRLIYQEFFEEQIKIFSRRKTLKSCDSIQINKINNFIKTNESLFPYQLTKDQIKTFHEIESDITSNIPMMRMIQGDVGCGKTSVAFLSALYVIHSRHQVALMCPTETLAWQHFNTFRKLLESTNFKISLLLGSTKPKEKQQILEGLSLGEIDLIIGTHSLFQESVAYHSLALAIIDEQHKFGVNQRIKLVSKTKGCHCLTMTATPIPRSLSLTQYGDLDLSIIKTIPSNRKGTQTRIVNADTYPKYLSFIKTRIEMGEQAYIVVPSIVESELQDMANLEMVLELYNKYFPDFKISGLHGKLKTEEKDEILHKFKNNQIHILIATSVIEVGIDIPNSTIMAILSPERFGLSSLHQLRGRVGRGDKPGFCFLVNDKEISESSLYRLKILEQSHDGFFIAEEDLKIRGEGDLFGKDQSGGTKYKISNIISNQDILEKVRIDLELLKEKYPEDFASVVDQYENDLSVLKTI